MFKTCLYFFLISFTLLLSTGTAQAIGPPNFLIILADDCTHRDLELYEGQAKSPQINRLAAEGMTFTRCFQAAPMCSPTRHNLYNGLYPVASGAYPNHAKANQGVRSMVHYLGDAGYRLGLTGKRHIAPRKVYPFENIPGFDANCNRSPTKPHSTDGIGKFMARDSEEPFALVVALVEPHGPWVMGDASAYPPEQLQLPPTLADTPETRIAYSKYLAEITYMDSQVGDILTALKESGAEENTFVIFLSEQGSGFPFAKWTCYDAGLQSAAVVRWPEVVAPGSKSDAMIEYVDVLPTFLEATGVEIPAQLEGKSFLSVLRGERNKHKSQVFGIQTTLGINNGSDHYGIRSVRSTDYLYIRNLSPETTFSCAASQGKVWDSWVRAAEVGDTHATALVHDFQHRPAEELYDVRTDPWNRVNRIADPDLAEVRAELRAKLDAWMKEQNDRGADTELEAFEHMNR